MDVVQLTKWIIFAERLELQLELGEVNNGRAMPAFSCRLSFVHQERKYSHV